MCRPLVFQSNVDPGKVYLLVGEETVHQKCSHHDKPEKAINMPRIKVQLENATKLKLHNEKEGRDF